GVALNRSYRKTLIFLPAWRTRHNHESISATYSDLPQWPYRDSAVNPVDSGHDYSAAAAPAAGYPVHLQYRHVGVGVAGQRFVTQPAGFLAVPHRDSGHHLIASVFERGVDAGRAARRPYRHRSRR